MIVIYIILSAIVLIAFIDLITLTVYGYPVKSKYYNKIINRLSEYRLNTYDDCILMHDNLKYISNVSNSPFFYYYICDVGPVFKYSKLHYAIKNRFKELYSIKGKRTTEIDKF